MLVEVVTVASLEVVVSSEIVDDVDEFPDVTDEAVSADVLVDDPALVTEVEVSSSPLAQATPTTRRAAVTAVNVAIILLIMRWLLFLRANSS